MTATHRRQTSPFVWEGGSGVGTFRSVTRQELTGAEHGQGTSLRYFEVGPGRAHHSGTA
ncbi:hypothetical protein OHA21_20045 [Actinoplanes sp. NBC_00393]|uniref:hypothetical protein n=1 Tax=Actinoplanes sp. NBC_00393 TaxID=2975953 RepID=UPI002E1A9E40